MSRALPQASLGSIRLRHIWLLATPIDCILPLASHTGTSHQNGFSISIHTPGFCLRACSTYTIGDGTSRVDFVMSMGRDIR